MRYVIAKDRKQSSFEGLGGRNEWTIIRMNELRVLNLFVSPFSTWVQEVLGQCYLLSGRRQRL